MRVVSLNANGIRSAARKGFFDWLMLQDVDVLCVQETKAQEHQLADDVFRPKGYHVYFVDAQKKGYSGVAIYCKQKPKHVVTSLGFDIADNEGRYVQIDYDHLSIASLYLPSGTSGDVRQAVKYDFLTKFEKPLRQFMQSGREYIVCGDWNIAHKKEDLKNWRGNQKSSGFLPEERAWMDKLLGEMGFVDAFRVVNQQPDQYSWWSHFGHAYENNAGWRIDYQMVTPGLKEAVRVASIARAPRFSDHAPVILDYDLKVVPKIKGLV